MPPPPTGASRVAAAERRRGGGGGGRRSLAALSPRELGAGQIDDRVSAPLATLV